MERIRIQTEEEWTEEVGFPKDKLNHSGKKRGCCVSLKGEREMEDTNSQNTTIPDTRKSLFALTLPSTQKAFPFCPDASTALNYKTFPKNPHSLGRTDLPSLYAPFE